MAHNNPPNVFTLHTPPLEEPVLDSDASGLSDAQKKQIQSFRRSLQTVKPELRFPKMCEMLGEPDRSFDSLYQLVQFIKSCLETCRSFFDKSRTSTSKSIKIIADLLPEGSSHWIDVDYHLPESFKTLRSKGTSTNASILFVVDTTRACRDPAQRPVTVERVSFRVDANHDDDAYEEAAAAQNEEAVRASTRGSTGGSRKEDTTTAADSAPTTDEAELEPPPLALFPANDKDSEKAQELEFKAQLEEYKYNRSMMDRLKQYHRKHGKWDVPPRRTLEDLHEWVEEQRMLYHQDELPDEQLEALQGIGFDWGEDEEQENSKHQQKRGQRRKGKKQQSSSPAEKEAAAEVEPETEAETEGGDDWNAQFAKLELFREAKGHCMIPLNFVEDRSMSDFVKHMRYAYKTKQLSQDKIEKLEKIGFVWDVSPGSAWQQQFERLKAYKDKHGDCDVPDDYPDDPELSKWVAKQRQRYTKSLLLPARVDLVELIGFSWDEKAESRRKKRKLQAEEPNVGVELPEDECARLQEIKVQLIEQKVALQEEKVNGIYGKLTLCRERDYIQSANQEFIDFLEKVRTKNDDSAEKLLLDMDASRKEQEEEKEKLEEKVKEQEDELSKQAEVILKQGEKLKELLLKLQQKKSGKTPVPPV